MKKFFAIFIPIAVAVIYIGISVLFMNRFPMRTTLNGVDVSGKKSADAQAALLKDIMKQSVTLIGKDGTETVLTAEDMKLSAPRGDLIDELAHRKNGFAWPVSLFKKTEYELDGVPVFRQEEILKAVEALPIFDAENAVPPTDAYYEFRDDRYVIVPETDGTLPVAEKVTEAVMKALIEDKREVDLGLAQCYETAAVTADDPDLNMTVTFLNNFASARLEFHFGDKTEVLDGDTIKTWIMSDTPEDGAAGTAGNEEGGEGAAADSAASGSPDAGDYFDEVQLRSFVADLSKKYDTYGRHRSFTKHDGSTMTITAGTYGWWMDQNSTAQAIKEAVSQGYQGDFEPVYFQKAASYGTPDYGNSYVEVDLDQQHVYVYQNGSLVTDTDCVSGKAITGNGTPGGIYALTYKEKDATLVGEGYTSPVGYWMPFNGNVGLHDASWRNEFGGKIYVESGSHGCVNLPVAAAGAIFNTIEKGEAVIVYGGMTQGQAQEYKTQREADEALLKQLEEAGVSLESLGMTLEEYKAGLLAGTVQPPQPAAETAPAQDQGAGSEAIFQGARQESIPISSIPQVTEENAAQNTEGSPQQ